jgi:histidine ammonia-lyase
LIVSHCAGVGEPLTIERARMMFALRINILAKGYSGISEDTLQRIIAAFNSRISNGTSDRTGTKVDTILESCIPEIPSQGTVGASGDLAPLAHLAAGLMGVGRMWSPKTGWGYAKDVLEQNGLSPIEFKPKEVSIESARSSEDSNETLGLDDDQRHSIHHGTRSRRSD